MKTGLVSLILASFAAIASGADVTLWEIGKPDRNTAKFALGPDDYKAYRQPGFFVVGHSDPKKDWPYVQPGPKDDSWAPGMPQTFEILFAVAAAPPVDCTLELYLADTHSRTPPRLRVEVNQQAKEFPTPPGGGDASIFGGPARGRPHTIRMTIPAGALKPGANRIAITTLSGSWILWDAVRFLAPADTELTAVKDFIAPHTEGPIDRLLRHDGKAVQTVAVRIFHSGAACDGRLQIGNQPSQSVSLQPGVQTVESFLPPVEKTETVPIVLTVGGAEPMRSEVTLQPVRKWEIYILMHSHNDIGYTDIQPHIAAKQAHNVVRALELIKKTMDYPPGARFKWNLEVMVPYDDFHAIATPEQEKEFARAVREGNIGVDAMYADLLTGVCRSEELLRQFTFAVALGRRCGVKVDSMQISDVPGLTWGVVPALVQNGVKYISDGPNANPFSMQGDRIGYVREQWEHRPFYWLSPSGRDKVLYWGAQGGYSIGHGFGSITVAIPFMLRRLERVKYPYDIVQMRWTKGDNGPPDEAVMDLVREWNAKYAYPRLIIATTTEAFHAFENRYADKLPTYRGDMTPYWEDGTASSARETAINRHTADRLCQAETLWAMLKPESYPAVVDRDAAAWKNVALYSEHTWGAYNSVSQPDSPFVKTQWKYKQKWALDAQRQAAELNSILFGDFSDFNLDEHWNAIDVINTSSWPRKGLVWLGKERKGSGVQHVPWQRLTSGDLVFLAENVPPFGAKRFKIDEAAQSGGKAHVEGNVLTTSALSIKLNEKTGAIESLHHASVDAELSSGAINSYIYLPGGNVKDAKSNGPVKITVGEAGPLVASLIVASEAPGCKKLTREVRVVDGLDYVEIIDTVDKLPVRAIEGVHFGFAFNVPNPVVHVNSPGAVIEPEKDQLPGACKNWLEVERWADVSNDKYGVTWVTADAPLLELGGLTANLPRGQPDPNVYMKHIEPSATLYSWVMNNHWHTNYRADQEGEVRFHYYLRPHKAYDPVEAAKFGIETTVPMLMMRPHDETLLSSRLQVEGSGVIVSAMKPSDDGRAIIVRLYGASGKDAKATLKWSDPVPKKIWLSDAGEQPLAAAGERIDVPGWGIVTLRADLP